jgi:hypothetical protein
MKHIKGYYEMIKESVDKSPIMDIGGKDMGRIIPMDLCQYSNLHNDYSAHQIFLVDDPRFMNKIVLVPGMLTFTKISEGEKLLLGKDWHNTPESLGTSSSNWRLMDIDEMEDFYDFYSSGGLGQYDEMIDGSGALDYGTSDLDDVDHPNRSRIYSINFSNGKRRSNYRHEEKLIIALRDVSDEDIFMMVKFIHDNVPLIQSTLIIEKVKKLYPHISFDSLFTDKNKDDIMKGASTLRNFGFN